MITGTATDIYLDGTLLTVKFDLVGTSTAGLRTDLTSLESAVATDTTTIQGNLDSHITYADGKFTDIASDTDTLRTDLDTEISDRIAGDGLLGATTGQLRTDLNTEIANRISEDDLIGITTGQLRADLNTEISDTNTDFTNVANDTTTIAGNLATLDGEVETSTTALQGNIDSLAYDVAQDTTTLYESKVSTAGDTMSGDLIVNATIQAEHGDFATAGIDGLTGLTMVYSTGTFDHLFVSSITGLSLIQVIADEVNFSSGITSYGKKFSKEIDVVIAQEEPADVVGTVWNIVINSALNMIPDGGHILVKKGTYTINAEEPQRYLDVSNVWWEAEEKTVIDIQTPYDETGQVIISSYPFVFENFKVYCSSTLVNYKRAINIGYPVSGIKSSEMSYIRNIKVRDKSVPSIYLTGIRNTDVDNLAIENCDIRVGNEGIVNDVSNNCTIRRNTLKGGQITCYSPEGSHRILDNVLTFDYAGASGSYYPIRSEGGIGNIVSRNKITFEVTYDTSSHWTRIIRIGESTGTIVSNNTIYSANPYDDATFIYITDGETYNTFINNNNIFNCGTELLDNGVETIYTSNNFRDFAGNLAISIQGTELYIDDITINNMLEIIQINIVGISTPTAPMVQNQAIFNSTNNGLVKSTGSSTCWDYIRIPRYIDSLVSD